MTMMAERSNAATDVAEQLGISVSTLYAYVDGEGQAKPRARKLLGGAGRCRGANHDRARKKRAGDEVPLSGHDHFLVDDGT